jgi:transcriptional regulator with XRE-family HTH domain
VQFNGPKMRARRRAAGVSIVSLSRATGQREETLRRWERGEAQPQTVAPIFAIARRIGVSADELFTEDVTESGHPAGKQKAPPSRS